MPFVEGVVAMANVQPTAAVSRLAKRLRDLREHEFARLTQSQLGQALGGADDTLTPAAISMWENPASGRLAPQSRLEAYAQLFCTHRSFENGLHMLGIAELTAQERDRFEELKQELLGLRHSAMPREEAAPADATRSMWDFPDGSRITLACDRLPDNLRPPHSSRDNLNYVRLAGLADLDALIDIYGAIRAYNPTSRVVFAAAQDLTQRDLANHLVLIGGLAWNTVTPSFSRIFPIPLETRDPADHGILIHDPDAGDRELTYTLSGDELVEDVGFFARGENPSAPRRTLTICAGVTTRGVLGAARCFIDWEMRERNEQYLMPRFPDGSTYCIVMRVPVVNSYPLTPDLSKPENRLYEWCSASTKAV